MNGQFAWQDSTTTNPNIFGFTDTTQISGFRANAAYRHIFTTRFNGSLTYDYSRQSTRTTPYFANRENIAGEAGITGDDQSARTGSAHAELPIERHPVALRRAADLHAQSDQRFGLQRLWMPRPHNITFGADFRRQQFNTFRRSDPRGTFSFTGAATEQLVKGVPVAGTAAISRTSCWAFPTPVPSPSATPTNTFARIYGTPFSPTIGGSAPRSP